MHIQECGTIARDGQPKSIAQTRTNAARHYRAYAGCFYASKCAALALWQKNTYRLHYIYDRTLHGVLCRHEMDDKQLDRKA